LARTCRAKKRIQLYFAAAAAKLCEALKGPLQTQRAFYFYHTRAKEKSHGKIPWDFCKR